MPLTFTVSDESRCLSDTHQFVVMAFCNNELAGKGNGTPLHILAWKIPWTEEPGGLQSMGSLRVGQD